ncbi:hypothetical protein GCM10009836_42910 [Pseudonocardia ailaonensis]|uniref:Uncharacterized protein n=1 Tax=Pseudonocardia ailaonensis TaxID=367279 RepID=A0ABN2N919_9PSEU
MSWTADAPTWVVPSRAEIADLHWLAYADAVETRSPSAGGITATLAWVRGGAVAPVTGRDQQPVTVAMAEAELWAAWALLTPDVPPPLEQISRDLGVPFLPPLPFAAGRGDGAATVLSWLLGTTTVPPMPLPARAPDGRPADAQTLVESAIAAAPHRIWGPEERHAARAAARQTVERSQRLLARIRAAQERVG